MGDLSKKKEKHAKGDKKSKKAKKSKKVKKDKAHKRRDSSSSDSDSSSGSLSAETPQAELQRIRRACTCVRQILGEHPGARAQLRQLLWNVDAGQAMDVMAVSGAQAPAPQGRLQVMHSCAVRCCNTTFDPLCPFSRPCSQTLVCATR
jgi:hypothetical protein